MTLFDILTFFFAYPISPKKNKKKNRCSDICQLESSLSDAEIAGLAIGSIAFYCILLFAGILTAYFRHSRRRDSHIEVPLSLFKNNDIPLLHDVVLGAILGKGNFGLVYQADWRGTQVACKSLKSTTPAEFVNELSILTNFRHPNVLGFLGVYQTGGEYFLVVEYMNKGDLNKFLQKNVEISINYLIDIAKQIAQGVDYIHSRKVVHRDIATRNMLVSGEQLPYTIKVSDFGLSRNIEGFYESQGAPVPIRWTSIEGL